MSTFESIGTDKSNSVRAAERIVVGVDGSAVSERALAWAAREAELRQATLEVVHASFSRREALEALDTAMIDEEESVLERALARAHSVAPGIALVGRLCDPPAGRALIEASAAADLLVIGSRGLSGLKELTLGSVSNECAHHALCPVAIVRPNALDRGVTARERSAAVPSSTAAER